MNIIVTGATGFVGTALCKVLEERGYNVVRLNSKNCDLTRDVSLDKFNNVSYDHIYHLAAWTQAGDFCLYHPGEQWIINQKINTNVLSWWQKFQPQAKLICMGTSCAYAPDLELVEKNYLHGSPIDSLYTYAMAKRMLYVGLISLNRQYGLKYLCFVPSTLYGPGYHTDGRQMHFIFDLIRKILRGQFYQEPVVLWGDGYQKRELVYIDDFINIILSINDKSENELINIGAGKEYDIRFFAELISKEVNYDFGKIRFDVSKYVGAKSKCLNINKMKDSLGEFKTTDLLTGIKNTINWLISNHTLI